MSFIAPFSRRTIGSGVPFGRKNAFQTLASTPARPCSPLVASCATTDARFAAISAMPFTVCALTCAAPAWMVSHM